jgi:hypothetical protein
MEGLAMRVRKNRPVRPCRYTVEQVLRGMQAFVTEHCGPEVVLDPDKSVNEYREAAAASHECPLEFLRDMASCLNLERNEGRWAAWLKLRGEASWSKRRREEAWEAWQREVAPALTVRALAEYIARRAVGQSLAPATVFGVTCAKAGVFLGLCDMPEVAGLRVAPSTPLQVLGRSSRIQNLWRRLEWVSGVKLPATRGVEAAGMSSLGDVVWALTCFASPIAAILALVSTYDVMGGACVLTALLAGFGELIGGWCVADRLHNPLPQGVVSFGDLARLVAMRLEPGASQA